MRYSGCPTIRFKLKEQTNIDDVINVKYFTMETKAQNSHEIDYIRCKIIGIRGMQTVPHYYRSENDVRWVKIEGCEYQLMENKIRQGLEPFGDLFTPIRVDSKSGDIGNGTGNYDRQKEISQLLAKGFEQGGTS